MKYFYSKERVKITFWLFLTQTNLLLPDVKQQRLWKIICNLPCLASPAFAIYIISLIHLQKSIWAWGISLKFSRKSKIILLFYRLGLHVRTFVPTYQTSQDSIFFFLCPFLEIRPCTGIIDDTQRRSCFFFFLCPSLATKQCTYMPPLSCARLVKI